MMKKCERQHQVSASKPLADIWRYVGESLDHTYERLLRGKMSCAR